MCIGYEAGAKETLGNRLYIANTNTEEPLVKGIFPNTSLAFNATEIGFYKHAVSTQPAAIASPAAELAALKTAVDGLREALKKVGLTA